MGNFTINFGEEFPHLSKAPIVEAVIDIRIVPTVVWDEVSLEVELKKQLTTYPKIEKLRESKYKISPERSASPIIEDFGCIGLKLHTNDNHYIAQFKKEQFVFSRLTPYENWSKFSREAMRLLKIYSKLRKPSEVRRIGLRFINRLVVNKDSFELGDYYKSAPEPVKGLDLPLTGFLHHDILQIIGTSYRVNLIKTVQKSRKSETGLILDIDVFLQSNFDYNETQIVKYLQEMRWVKNKVFFNSVTEKIIEELK